MTLCGRRPVLPPVHRKGYQRTQRVTCHGHTIVHDINYLDGSLSIVNDFWVVFPNLLLQAFLRDTPSRKTGRPPGSVSGGGAGGGRWGVGEGTKPPCFPGTAGDTNSKDTAATCWSHVLHPRVSPQCQANWGQGLCFLETSSEERRQR